jgi:hypothetical protein
MEAILHQVISLDLNSRYGRQLQYEHLRLLESEGFSNPELDPASGRTREFQR